MKQNTTYNITNYNLTKFKKLDEYFAKVHNVLNFEP